MKARPIRSGALAAMLCIATALAGAAAPPTITVAGEELVRAGQGERKRWFIDLYKVGFYLPRGRTILSAAADRSVPKAFRIQVTYEGKLPDDIPRQWRQQLLPPLDGAQARALNDMYARLQRGDVVMVRYVPGDGTRLNRNGVHVLSTPGHRLMAAFVDLFLGANPVSEDLRAELLGR